MAAPAAIFAAADLENFITLLKGGMKKVLLKRVDSRAAPENSPRF